jgi:hypothetical protein
MTHAPRSVLTLAFGLTCVACDTARPGDAEGGPDWDVGDIPTRTGQDEPWSCEFLAGDNCYKTFVRTVRACLPQGEGQCDETGKICTFPGGGTLEWQESFALTFNTYLVGNTLVRADDGTPCHVVKTESGRTIHHTPGMTIVQEQTSLTTSRWICPDGSSYDQGADGACPTMWDDWQAGKLPLYWMSAPESGGLTTGYDGAGDASESLPGISCDDFDRDALFPPGDF